MKVLAHKILFEEKIYHLSVVDFSSDYSQVNISKFEQETPNTIFVNGTIKIVKNDDGTFGYLPVDF